jgi:hypothetical protein
MMMMMVGKRYLQFLLDMKEPKSVWKNLQSIRPLLTNHGSLDLHMNMKNCSCYTLPNSLNAFIIHAKVNLFTVFNQ